MVISAAKGQRRASARTYATPSRNWHRANRWNVALSALAVEEKFLMPLPTMDAAGMMRITVMEG